MHSLTIGQVAKATGLPIDTIRYYEREGLIPAPRRRASGYRDYPSSTVERLHFIGRAKELGFTLAEAGELLALSAQGRQDMAAMKAAAQAKLAVVDERLRELERIRDGLRALVSACPGHGAVETCPILGALRQHSEAGI